MAFDVEKERRDRNRVRVTVTGVSCVPAVSLFRLLLAGPGAPCLSELHSPTFPVSVDCSQEGDYPPDSATK